MPRKPSAMKKQNTLVKGYSNIKVEQQVHGMQTNDVGAQGIRKKKLPQRTTKDKK
jgi:hypothetical protein